MSEKFDKDKELEILMAIVKSLREVGEDERVRIIRAVTAFYGLGSYDS